MHAGGQRLVVMNADGSAGIEVSAALSLRAPFLRRLAVGLLVAGLVAAPLGGLPSPWASAGPYGPGPGRFLPCELRVGSPGAVAAASPDGFPQVSTTSGPTGRCSRPS